MYDWWLQMYAVWGWESLWRHLWGKIRLISNTNTSIWRQTWSAHKIRLEGCVRITVLSYLQDKASRIERIVGEHRLFSEGLKELQDWVCEAQRVIRTCTSTTTDKGVLEDRMLQLEVRRDEMVVGSLKMIEMKNNDDKHQYAIFIESVLCDLSLVASPALEVIHFQFSLTNFM